MHTEWTLAARFNITSRAYEEPQRAYLFLEWVTRPEDGNHAACNEASKMLARILDEALNSQSNVDQPRQHVLEHSNNEAVPTLEEDNMMLDLNDCDALPVHSEAFLEWFDSVDWNNPMGC